MQGLSKRQREVADFIKDFVAQHRHSPSFRDIQKHFGFSSLGSVYAHINLLKRKGVLTQEKHCSRSLALVDYAEPENKAAAIDLPLIGHISEGMPIEMFARSASVSVPLSLIAQPDNTYILKVKGDSLQDQLLADGDLLIVEARQNVHIGETIVAFTNDQETLVRKFYMEDGYVKLKSGTPHQHPLILHPEDLSVQGAVIASLRYYGCG